MIKMITNIFADLIICYKAFAHTIWIVCKYQLTKEYYTTSTFSI